MFGRDSDDEYDEYLKDGSMMGAMDKDEWDRREERAQDIATGLSSGMFESDEDIWERVKQIKGED